MFYSKPVTVNSAKPFPTSPSPSTLHTDITLAEISSVTPCSSQWTFLHHNNGNKLGGTELRNGTHDVFQDICEKPKYLFYVSLIISGNGEFKKVNLN